MNLFLIAEPILDRIRRKIRSWSARLLSYAGRLTLIRSLLFHFQVYWSNAFLIPKGVLQQNESLYRNYLWSGATDSRNMPLIAWDRLTLPSNEGGLGLLQLKVWNRAAFGKLLWKIIANKDCLWVKWAKAMYLKGKSIWCVQAKDGQPWAWRKLLQLRGMFSNHITYNLGDGRQMSLFYDNWLHIGSIRDIIGDTTIVWGSDVSVNNWWDYGGQWNIPISFCRRYPNIVDEISKFTITDTLDSVNWNFNTSMEYSVNSMYELYRERGRMVYWDKIVWITESPPRFNFCNWLL